MKTLAALLLAVPLTNDSGWQVLTYDRIPAHTVRFAEKGLTIEVKRSAAPLVYPLPTPLRVQSVRARGHVSGTLNVSARQQGQVGFDDYALRLGLVEVGGRRPGFLERRFAPAWLRRLWNLVPAGTGVSQVRFFNLGVNSSQKGQRRRHPMSTLVLEQVVAVPDPNGRFDIHETLEPVVVAAIWISADGDDTRSSYVLTLERLELVGTAADAPR